MKSYTQTIKEGGIDKKYIVSALAVMPDGSKMEVCFENKAVNEDRSFDLAKKKLENAEYIVAYQNIKVVEKNK